MQPRGKLRTPAQNGLMDCSGDQQICLKTKGTHAARRELCLAAAARAVLGEGEMRSIVLLYHFVI